ncbi:MAG: hypothetical protein ACFFFH_19545 [Candidatus Thorarchaeota archaeon]
MKEVNNYLKGFRKRTIIIIIIFLWYLITGVCYAGGLFIYYYVLLEYVDVYPPLFFYALLTLFWPFIGFLLSANYISTVNNIQEPHYTFLSFNVIIPFVTIFTTSFSVLLILLVRRLAQKPHNNDLGVNPLDH